jgi:outer membrane protein
MVESNIYREADDEWMPVPYIAYQGERFYFEGLEMGYRLLDRDRFSFSILTQYRMDGYEADDSPFLRGMDEREGTLEAGLAVEVELPVGELELEGVTDVLGEHEGQEISLSYEVDFEFDRFSVTPFVAVTWQSENFTDYYYGVTPRESRSWRAAYEVDSALNPEAGIQVGYEISDHWALMSEAGVTFLDSTIEDSPIVDEGYAVSGFLGVFYRF